jgi:predicted RNase H-like HicB family nuclease
MKDSENKKIHLPVLIELDEDGIYIVSCPVFKACHSYGQSIDEALNNLREVVAICLEEDTPLNLNHFVGFRELEIVA